jgi:tripartite motif-containing protein 33
MVLSTRLTNVINKRCKKIVQTLNEVCDEKQRTLEDKRSTLEQITKLTDHCITAVSHQLETGSDLALLFSKK